MKKQYLQPLTECAKFNTLWALCGQGGSGFQGQGSGGDQNQDPNPAPQRRVF